MEAERRNQLVLGLLVVVLLAVIYRSWTDTSPGPAVAGGVRGAPGTERTTAAQGSPATPEVHLEALRADRPRPGAADRDLFRFKQKPLPPPTSLTGPAAKDLAPAVPSGPPPPPPITLKFIGIIDQGSGKPKLAVLTDGLGPPLYGFEGEPVAGRFRILKIGAESIDISYLDGRGRTTIRLSGG